MWNIFNRPTRRLMAMDSPVVCMPKPWAMLLLCKYAAIPPPSRYRSNSIVQVLRDIVIAGRGSANGNKVDMVSKSLSDAAKLYDLADGGAGGSKQDAVNSAGMSIMQLIVQTNIC